jgi:phage tail-like protein
VSWLVAQLPQVMARDPLIGQFVSGCQEVADTLRGQIDDLEHEIDVDLASPEMLAYLGSWLGVTLTDDPDPAARAAQRRLVRAVGQILTHRGTEQGLEVLLTALTGSRVTVHDPGGIYLPGEVVPAGDGPVRIELGGEGPVTVAQLHTMIQAELPVGVGYHLVVAGRDS